MKPGILQGAGDEEDGDEDEEAEAEAPEQDELDKAIAESEPGAPVDDDGDEAADGGSSVEGSVRQTRGSSDSRSTETCCETCWFRLCTDICRGDSWRSSPCSW